MDLWLLYQLVMLNNTYFYTNILFNIPILVIATCGGIIRGDSGQLTSPHFPSIHTLPINTICTWKIIGPIDHYLRITFNEIKLPFRPNCSTSNHLLITEKIQFGNGNIIFCQ